MKFVQYMYFVIITILIFNSSEMKSQPIQYLQLKTSKGFAFNIPNSIVLTNYPSVGIIFFLQCSVRFFDGSNFIEMYNTQNPISTINLRGKKLAIGQKLMKGQLTNTTVISLQNKKAKVFKYQKTAIQFLSLSVNSEYLCSVGSSDPSKQQFLIIDLNKQLQFGFKTVCEEVYLKKQGRIVSAIFSNNDPNLLGVTFANKFTIIKIDGQKTTQRVAKSNKVREFSMSLFDPFDMSCFVASKNGDISEINLKQMKQTRIGPRKRVIISGIKHIRFVKPNRIIITGVKGFIAQLQLQQLKILKQVTIKQQIIALTQFEGDLGFVSTDKASIYILDADTLNIRQFYTCHSAKVNQICFLNQYCQVFASCSDKQIIVWRNHTLNPLIKINIPNTSCLSLNLLHDGSSVVSGWSDECIRFFNPKNGKKINQIRNAHIGKVTALTSNNASDRLFSGGQDGRIRSWKLDKQRFGIIQHIFSGHRAQVHFLKLFLDELYSCSQDGTFAIWSLQNATKKVMVRSSNFLKKVIPIDQYSLYGIGSGPNLLKIAKNDGRIKQTLQIGGSHLNDFDHLQIQDKQPGYQGSSSERRVKSFLVFGGELHSVFIRKFDMFDLGRAQVEEHNAYGEVTCVKFAPDASTLIAGTDDGSLLCFIFKEKGF